MSTKTNRPRAKSVHKPASTKPRAKPAAKASASKRKAPSEPAPTGSKQSQLIAVLRSPAGSTIEQMTSLTGWQPRTVRGTISGVLRKRLGLQVTTEACSAGGTRVYRIVGAPA